MSNCKEWMDTDSRDRILLVGQIVHLLQNDSTSFIAMSSMVRQAENNGAFNEVTILPEFTNTTP